MGLCFSKKTAVNAVSTNVSRIPTYRGSEDNHNRRGTVEIANAMVNAGNNPEHIAQLHQEHAPLTHQFTNAPATVGPAPGWTIEQQEGEQFEKLGMVVQDPQTGTTVQIPYTPAAAAQAQQSGGFR